VLLDRLKQERRRIADVARVRDDTCRCARRNDAREFRITARKQAERRRLRRVMPRERLADP
jgi:hypothetical protein